MTSGLAVVPGPRDLLRLLLPRSRSPPHLPLCLHGRGDQDSNESIYQVNFHLQSMISGRMFSLTPSKLSSKIFPKPKKNTFTLGNRSSEEATARPRTTGNRSSGCSVGPSDQRGLEHNKDQYWPLQVASPEVFNLLCRSPEIYKLTISSLLLQLQRDK